MEGYCVKCRAKKEMKNPTPTTFKNGKPAVTGICPDCATKMVKFVKKEG